MIHLGGISGTGKVRAPSRGYKYQAQYEKYYRGQVKNIRNNKDFGEWLNIVLDGASKGHISTSTLYSVLDAAKSKVRTFKKKNKNFQISL